MGQYFFGEIKICIIFNHEKTTNSARTGGKRQKKILPPLNISGGGGKKYVLTMKRYFRGNFFIEKVMVEFECCLKSEGLKKKLLWGYIFFKFSRKLGIFGNYI